MHCGSRSTSGKGAEQSLFRSSFSFPPSLGPPPAFKLLPDWYAVMAVWSRTEKMLNASNADTRTTSRRRSPVLTAPTDRGAVLCDRSNFPVQITWFHGSSVNRICNRNLFVHVVNGHGHFLCSSCNGVIRCCDGSLFNAMTLRDAAAACTSATS